jgi:rRNA maturation RNase YbeY
MTFDYVEGDVISGDIMISVDRVAENAVSFGNTFEQELLRVIIHGILHLLGQGDKTDEDAAEMRRRENFALQLWNTII